MFAASESFLLFDYFRVPYERVDRAHLAHDAVQVDTAVGWLRPKDSSSELLWAHPGARLRGRAAGEFKLGSISMFGSVLPDDEAVTLLSRLRGTWQRSTPICDHLGDTVASIWTDTEGSTFLPFNPNEVIERYWSESYLDLWGAPWRRSTLTAARRAYHRVRPYVPRGAQMQARRWFSRRQSRRQFPAWPVETALHDFYRMLFTILSELAHDPIPMISLWPGEHSWAFVLTHDVETADGYANIELLCDIEVSAGYRSSWNFVPRNHAVIHESVLDELRAQGFEVGVHGLRHDGRDIEELDARLPEIRRYAERWGASGFRSPSTLRSWDAMPRLPFEYDSTYFDTSPFEPQPGGCCTWLPYMNEHLVELPVTLPQDHTLFEILGLEDATVWLTKIRFLKGQGGMALMLTHPDYAHNERLVAAYRAVLDEFAEDTTAWKVLPREVSEWWKRRAASEVQRRNDGWTIIGPAADGGTVQLLTPIASRSAIDLRQSSDAGMFGLPPQ